MIRWNIQKNFSSELGFLAGEARVATLPMLFPLPERCQAAKRRQVVFSLENCDVFACFPKITAVCSSLCVKCLDLFGLLLLFLKNGVDASQLKRMQTIASTITTEFWISKSTTFLETFEGLQTDTSKKSTFLKTQNPK